MVLTTSRYCICLVYLRLHPRPLLEGRRHLFFGRKGMKHRIVFGLDERVSINANEYVIIWIFLLEFSDILQKFTHLLFIFLLLGAQVHRSKDKASQLAPNTIIIPVGRLKLQIDFRSQISK